MSAYLQAEADRLREQAIAAEFQAMLDAISPAVRREHADTMAELINGRSAAQVARMERARGLG